MKTPYLITILVIVLLVIGYLLINRLAIISYDGDAFSSDAGESKIAGIFLSYYIPNKDSIRFKNKSEKAPLAWAEYGWKTESGLFSTNRDVNKSQMNFVIMDTFACKNPDYIYVVAEDSRSLNCLKGLGFVSKVWQYYDTITVYIKQGSDSIGWRQEIITDTIIYTPRH
jgi:hypothetical protein